jgi:integrase
MVKPLNFGPLLLQNCAINTRKSRRQLVVARLTAEDIDWKNQVLSFFRAKTGTAQILHFDNARAELFKDLPRQGMLFPRLEKHRASLFQMICRRLNIKGISLPSYRYAWAERAKVAGMPERFAQEALGHNGKALHRAYAKKAQMKIPSLEDYEKYAPAKL